MVEDATEPADIAALGQLVVNRLHYTYSVQDLYTFREDYRYVFSRVGKLRKLPLQWREREIQANMVTLDASNRNLVYLPSGEVKQLMEGYLLKFWNVFVSSLPASQGPGLAGRLVDILGLVRFEPTEREIERARETLEQIAKEHAAAKGLEEFVDFAHLLEGYYIPFVQIEESDTRAYTFVRHGVDVFLPYSKRPATPHRHSAVSDYSLDEILKFLFIGKIHFDVPIPLIAFHFPPWASTESLHIKVNLPAGLEIDRRPSGVPKSLFTDTKILELASRDETSVYFYISNRDGRELLERRKRASAELDQFVRNFRSLLDAFKKQEEGKLIPVLKTLIGGLLELRRKQRKVETALRPEIRVRARMGLGMGSLLMLLWLVVSLAYLRDILSGLGLSDYLSFLSVLFVVVISIAVFSIDKPYLRLPIYSHVIAATLSFVDLPALRGLAALFTG